MQSPLLLDKYDAATLLAVTTRQLTRLVRNSELPCVRLPGGETRFDPDDLREWVESHKRPANGQRGGQ
jgi:excisionase family DNA binding protein